jgi:phage/plasmid-associated DNA primase
VKVVEFPPLEEKLRDPAVKEAIKCEGTGILNWAIEGLDIFRQDGKFAIPACVKDATQQWQRFNDIPAAFLEEQCERDPLASIAAGALYLSYRNWCIDNGNKPQSSTSLAQDWKRLGISKKHTMNGWFYEGIKLKP